VVQASAERAKVAVVTRAAMVVKKERMVGREGVC
jgi:hypothetical protein